MRRFRQFLKEQEFRYCEPSYDTKQLKDEVHLLFLLDNCSQILRDDRIWLRKRVKDNDEEVICILKTALKNAHKQINMVNLKQLQISLRRYISRIKERQKQEQLLKFKENILLNEYKKKTAASEQFSVLSSHNKSHQKNKESFSLPRQSSLLSKLHQPIEQEGSSDKQSSYRSRSSEPFSHCQRDISSKNPVQRKEERNPLSRRSSNEGRAIESPQLQERVPNLKQSKSNAILNQRTNNPKPSQQTKKEVVKNAQKDLKLDTFRDKQQLITFKPTLTAVVERIEKKQKAKPESLPVAKPQIQSAQAPPTNKPVPVMSAAVTPHSASLIQYSQVSLPVKQNQNDEELFTSPELLMECRMFIERNSISKKRGLFPSDDKVIATLEKRLDLSREQQPERDCELQTQNPINLPCLQQNFTNSSQQSETSKRNLKKRIEDELAEDVFDELMGEKTTVVDFHVLLQQKYENTPTLQNIVRRSANEMPAQEVGGILDVYCQKQSNQMKELYNYIDLDQNGFITLQDMEAFLNQVLQSEDDPMYKLGMSVFGMGTKDGRMQYWGMHQIKKRPQMAEFLAYLSQYQFQVET